MPPSGTLIAFALAAAVLVAVPGPNFAFIVARSASQGRRAGFASAFGVEAGTLVHVAVAAVGFSAMLAASPALLDVIRYAGAAYLAYLGVRGLRRAAAPAQPQPEHAARGAFVDGLLVNVLNPKVVLFFVAFVPQFVSRDADAAQARVELLVLGAVLVVIGLTAGLSYAAAGAALGRRVRYGRLVGRVTAVVYLVLAATAVLAW